jgi:hypothetical protein
MQCVASWWLDQYGKGKRSYELLKIDKIDDGLK